MHTYRLTEAAQLLGVSDDTVRRWVDADRLPTTQDSDGKRVVEGAALAAFAVALAGDPAGPEATSARNAFPGIVTRVLRGDVVSQVEVLSGQHRLVSLMTTESVDALGLAPGVPARASVKSTHVVVEVR
ncbi:MAG: binding domain, excisionase family [Frankiales bacterium]|nr:binding domain, excisionase family [Frankiales bacterium]